MRRHRHGGWSLLNEPTSQRRFVLGASLLLTAVAAAHTWLMLWGSPNERLTALAAVGPGSNPYITGMAVTLAWLAVVAALALLTASTVTPARATVVIGYAVVALLYINVMRERTYYGDFDNYFRAAVNLREGTSLPPRYLYPPLWASLLAPLSVLGEQWTFAVAWALNLLSALGVFLLLPRVLERYGFGQPLAFVTTLLFAVVNVPVLRTLGYAQINLHVLAAILAALYWYPRHRFWSAAALAIAVNLKLSPLTLAIAFLVVRDVRWLGMFVLAVGVVASLPAAAYGWQPYGDTLNNLLTVMHPTGVAFRDASIDSFVRATGLAVGVDLEALIWPAKLAFAGGCLALALVHVEKGTFVAAGAPAAAVYNAMPVLLIMMVMASPLVWEHHPVFLALSYIAIATVLAPGDWVLFGCAYFLEFMMPTFDFYPWSYGRLLSPLILLALAWRRREHGQSSAFIAANRVLASLIDPGARLLRT